MERYSPVSPYEHDILTQLSVINDLSGNMVANDFYISPNSEIYNIGYKKGDIIPPQGNVDKWQVVNKPGSPESSGVFIYDMPNTDAVAFLVQAGSDGVTSATACQYTRSRFKLLGNLPAQKIHRDLTSSSSVPRNCRKLTKVREPMIPATGGFTFGVIDYEVGLHMMYDTWKYNQVTYAENTMVTVVFK